MPVLSHSHKLWLPCSITLSAVPQAALSIDIVKLKPSQAELAKAGAFHRNFGEMQWMQKYQVGSMTHTGLRSFLLSRWLALEAVGSAIK